jgi:hypothetical protein
MKQKSKEWHNWFAWHPVKAEDHWYWFETIERKWVPSTLFTTPYLLVNYWVYRKSTLRAG